MESRRDKRSRARLHVSICRLKCICDGIDASPLSRARFLYTQHPPTARRPSLEPRATSPRQRTTRKQPFAMLLSLVVNLHPLGNPSPPQQRTLPCAPFHRQTASCGGFKGREGGGESRGDKQRAKNRSKTKKSVTDPARSAWACPQLQQPSDPPNAPASRICRSHQQPPARQGPMRPHRPEHGPSRWEQKQERLAGPACCPPSQPRILLSRRRGGLSYRLSYDSPSLGIGQTRGLISLP